MPLFSKRKSGKRSSKDNKYAAGRDSAKDFINPSEKSTDSEIQKQQYFNGVPATPDPRNDYLYAAVKRSSISTAKCLANFPRRSRLSKSLPEILVDDSILPLFMEFLQKQGAQNILNFWLAAETFRLSARNKTFLPYKSKLKAQTSLQDPVHSVNSYIFNGEHNSKIVVPTSHVSEGDREIDARKDFLSKHGQLCTGSSCNKDVKTADCSRSSVAFPASGKLSEPSKCAGSDIQENCLKKKGHFAEASVGQDVNFIPIEKSQMNCLEENRLCYPSCHNGLAKDSKETNHWTETYKQFCGDDVSAPGEYCSVVQMAPSVEEGCVLQDGNDKSGKSLERSKSMMDDALSIYRHFISLDASQPLGVDEDIRRQVESAICSEDGHIDADCFNVAQNFAFDAFQNRYLDDFIRSSYYQKHIMDILTSGKVFLADVMYNDDAVFYFMEFMEQEGKSFLLAFWYAVDSFCQELQSKLDKGEYNSEEALADAMVLYEKYFSMQATHSLGVSDETRIRIENKICREEGPLPDCFEEPMENTLTLLEEVYFPIFLESTIYFKYLNELFSSVLDVDNDRASVDDCCSTTSGSETSKLMESLANDVEAPEDPDEIWQRPNFGLSIGRVNEYGVYIPGIEPQPGPPHKTGASKLSQKMKKLVSGDSEKVKEEMAWQVAKMVLEDVKKQQRKGLR